MDRYYGSQELNFSSELDNITSIGSHYFVGDFKPSTMPKLELKKVTPISYPVKEEEVKKLIENASQAPFGKGTETIVDTSVRKVWQIETASLKQVGMPGILTGICAKVSEGLGLYGEKIKANLYKMFVYEKGSFFLPHKDSEKEDKMFGTLVISLPSEHKGGDLVIRHSGKEDVISLENSDPGTLRYAAFYADVDHEVREVTEGNRICLVYNLIKSGKREFEEDISKIIKSQDHAHNIINALLPVLATATNPILYVLGHSYAPASFSMKKLKGKDQTLTLLLSHLSNRYGFQLTLGILQVEEEGMLYSDDARTSDIPSEGLGEPCRHVMDTPDLSFSLGHIQHLRGETIEGSHPVRRGTIYPKQCLNGIKADKKSITEITGNEGSTYEKFYRRAVLIIEKAKQTNNNSNSSTNNTQNDDDSDDSDDDDDVNLEHQNKKLKLDPSLTTNNPTITTTTTTTTTNTN